MKRSKLYISTLLIALLGGCAAEEEGLQPVEPDGALSAADGIVVSGGSPDAVLMNETRANEPRRPGFCNADRLDLSWYTTRTGAGGSVDASDNPKFNLKHHVDELQMMDPASAVYNGNPDRYWEYKEVLFKEDVISQRYHILGRGLAYTKADKDNGNFTYALGNSIYKGSDKDNTLGTITLKTTLGTGGAFQKGEKGTADKEGTPDKYAEVREYTATTPELYYGGITQSGGTMADLTGIHNRHTGHNDLDVPFRSYYWNTAAVSGNYVDVNPLNTGAIYRIVSQFNIIMTEIPDNVEKIELLCSNFPTKVDLDPDNFHGMHYPVSDEAEIISETIDDPFGNRDGAGNVLKVPVNTLIDSKVPAENNSVTLSAYLLPSKAASQMTLRVTYKHWRTVTDAEGNPQKDADGNEIREEYTTFMTYPVQPASTVTAAGLQAVYQHLDAARKSGDKDIVIYDNSKGVFYSYSNIRTTVRGTFNHIAAETTPLYFQIEVEPYFEATHHITLN